MKAIALQTAQLNFEVTTCTYFSHKIHNYIIIVNNTSKNYQLPYNIWDTFNSWFLGCKWTGNRSFSLAERDAHVCCL